MIDLTPEANSRFEQYLTRMRSALRGSRSVEPSEIEANVREHVEIALAGATAPVGADRLGQVLEQLGPPERWLTDDDRPWWRRIMHRLSSGEEPWRLAYIAFGFFALAVLLLPIGIGVFLLALSFLISRAEVELLAERGETLGARRWLVLPSIWVVLVMISIAALVMPVVALGSLGLSDGQIHFVMNEKAPPESLERARVETGFVATVAGVWWLVLSGIFAAILKPFRTLFLPVTTNLGRRHAAILALVGVMVGAIGAALLFVIELR